MSGLTVNYNGNAIKIADADEQFTLKTNGKVMADDVEIVADSDVTSITASYNSATIVNGTGGNTYTLKTNGKIMASDIECACEMTPALNYIEFASENSFTLGVGNSTKNWGGTLEYCTDGTTWVEWDASTITASQVDGAYIIRLRGTGNSVISGASGKKFVLTGTNVTCSGNIENLLDYATVAQKDHPTMANNCFQSLFDGCTALISAPELASTSLKNYCYSYMFSGCTNLAQAPDLPATTLKERCYAGMFYGCSSLTKAPELPAASISSFSYNAMFQNCTALVTPPSAVGGTFAGDSGCASMFKGCTALTTVPKLPATTQNANCYSEMFSGCTNLEALPELPTASVKSTAYTYMFSGCTKIKLSTTADAEYVNEFRIPSSGTGSIVSGATASMFANTGGTFTGAPAANTTYYTSNTIVSAA